MRKVWFLLIAVIGLLAAACNGPMDPNDPMMPTNDPMMGVARLP